MASDSPASTSEQTPAVLAVGIDKKEMQFTASHAKITIPSNDLQNYDILSPSAVPDTATNGVSITNLEYIYLTNAVAHKAINIWANKILGNGFDLVPSDEEGIDPITAEQAVNECKKFLKKIKYRTTFRQSIINALVAGNEWTELNLNAFNHVVNVSHADFQTVDFRRNFLTNKILLGADGQPIGYWQYIPDLSQLYHSLNMMYGEMQTYENMQAARNRLKESQSIEVKDAYGNPVAVMTTKPNFMFIKKEEIVHLAFDTLNDNPLGVSIIIPAYNALNHLEQVMYAVAEAINDMGYPKPDVKVGDMEHPPEQKLMDAAQDMVTDPVRRESYVHSGQVEIKYLQAQGMGNGGIAEYPEWFFTEASIGFGLPKDKLTSTGESHADASQTSNDFDKDVEAKRATFEEYVYEILGAYLDSRDFKQNYYGRNPYVPQLKWDSLITADEALREKMALEKWEKDAITFNELRVMLGMDEIEDMERADKYYSELNQPQRDSAFNTDGGLPRSSLLTQDGTGDAKNQNPAELQSEAQAETSPDGIQPKPPQQKQFVAQHSLLPKTANPSRHVTANESLNRQFGTEDVNYRAIAKESVGTKIKSVDKTTALKIRDALVNNEAKKESSKKIMEDIKKMGGYTDAHAKMVAATEHKNLEEHGGLENAMKKGYKFKTWKAHLDKDTSPLCRALNGKTIPIGKAFKVSYKDEGGKSKTWEGQAPAAHPSCRSVLIFGNENDGFNG
jgi:SPP1 gp7 family putative phage head morphogenesis protein